MQNGPVMYMYCRESVPGDVREHESRRCIVRESKEREQRERAPPSYYSCPLSFSFCTFAVPRLLRAAVAPAFLYFVFTEYSLAPELIDFFVFFSVLFFLFSSTEHTPFSA